MTFDIGPAQNISGQAGVAAELLWESSHHYLECLYGGDKQQALEDLQYHWQQPSGLLSHKLPLSLPKSVKVKFLALRSPIAAV